MIKLEIQYKNQKAEMDFEKNEVSIGKSDQCDLKIKGWFIAEHHATIKKLSGGYVVEDNNRGSNGTIVNDKKVDYYGPLDVENETITIGSYQFKIIEAIEKDLPTPQKTVHTDIDDTDYEVVHDDTSIIVDAPQSNQQLKVVDKYDQAYAKYENEWVVICRQKLVEKMDLRRKDVASMTQEELKEETLIALDQVLFDLSVELPDILNVESLKKRVLDESIGLGPLEDLLEDDSVTEIMVNARNEIFIERSGKIVKSSTEFTSDKSVIDIIERIVAPLGRKIDESSPMVDARLSDGSRVNAIIPPLAIKGPSITIRKFPKKNLQVDDLIGFGSITNEMAEFLEICVKYKKNVVISGGTGSGKTTLLNLLSEFIPHNERIITIEDAAELRLSLDHLISLEARPSNSEGKGAVPIRDLVKNSLRMRPDRIVIGECRGSETLDMLQAMNTGHEGSLTTLHSNSPRDAIARMETMVMMAGMDLPITAIRDQIASAVDIIVQQTRLSCGARKVTYITEVTGMESGKIQLQDIFRFHRTGFDKENKKTLGEFRPEGVVPTFYDDLRSSGIDVSLDMFNVEEFS